MNTKLFARLGAIGMVSVTTFAGAAPRADANLFSFEAALTGAARGTMSGSATFDRITASTGKPAVFTLNLDSDGSGTVLFTHTGGTSLRVGSYRVSHPRASGDLKALIRFGRAGHPAAAFRAGSGTLTITSVSDNTITGFFALDANEFLTAQPGRENQRVHIRGSFSAKEN
jgi:hypothetical protein